MNHTLIIFDCDGVLVDSEVLSIQLLMEMFQDAGLNLSTTEAYRALLGKQVRKASQSIKDVLDLKAPELDFDIFNERLHDSFRKGLKPVSGVRLALSQLDNPKCVASSSNPARLNFSLSLTKLKEHFNDRIFSADQVARGKPNPDLFLFAADQMGFEAKNCIVVEDSPAGIEAAKTAGMKVIGFCGGSHAEPAGLLNQMNDISPDLVFDEMKLLPDCINSLL